MPLRLSFDSGNYWRLLSHDVHVLCNRLFSVPTAPLQPRVRGSTSKHHTIRSYIRNRDLTQHVGLFRHHPHFSCRHYFDNNDNAALAKSSWPQGAYSRSRSWAPSRARWKASTVCTCSTYHWAYWGPRYKERVRERRREESCLCWIDDGHRGWACQGEGQT
jgi:hypothetical protein